MAISSSEAPKAGGGNFGKRPRFAAPSNVYDLVIVDILATTREIKGKVEPRYDIVCAIVSGDPNSVPKYPFQQDPENYNPYGTRIFHNVSRKLSNGGGGSKESALHAFISKVDRSRGKMNGKPLTDEEVKVYVRDVTKLNNLIGQNFRAAVEWTEGKDSEPDCPREYNNLGTLMPWSGAAKPLQEITLVLPAEVLADAKPELVYVDTNEVATGYYVFNGRRPDGEFDWKFINQEDAANACIEKHGKLVSPAYQAQLNKEKPAAANA